MGILGKLYIKYQQKSAENYRKKLARKKRGASGKPPIDPNILFIGKENFRLEAARFHQKTGHSLEYAMPRELYWQGQKIKGRDFFKKELQKYLSQRGSLRERQFREWLRRNGMRTRDSKRIISLLQKASSRYARVHEAKTKSRNIQAIEQKKMRADRAINAINTVKTITGFASPKKEHFERKSDINVEEIKAKQSSAMSHLGIQERVGKHQDFAFGEKIRTANTFAGQRFGQTKGLTKGQDSKPLTGNNGRAPSGPPKPSAGIGLKKF